VRRLIQVITLAAVFMTALAAPAMADSPITFSDSRTFTDVNPCTGLEHEITLNFDVSIHAHANNLVVTAQRSGSTDSGDTMIAGTETFVANTGGERATFVDQWRNPSGYKYMVRGNFMFNANTGELQFDTFGITCMGNS
jgi:hypothetical protein